MYKHLQNSYNVIPHLQICPLIRHRPVLHLPPILRPPSAKFVSVAFRDPTWLLPRSRRETAMNKSLNALNKTSSCTSSATGSDDQSLLPQSGDLASEEVKKSKPKPPMLNLSIRNIYYTHSSSGKSSLGSPGSPAECGLM